MTSPVEEYAKKYEIDIYELLDTLISAYRGMLTAINMGHSDLQDQADELGENLLYFLQTFPQHLLNEHDEQLSDLRKLLETTSPLGFLKPS